ncbi:hypothetical protein B0H13DRAFT_1860282 [Mycena leptocephala]|nr:hypothetical protein B0H13DRAFT_1860282 [Mycena leptocephala]
MFRLIFGGRPRPRLEDIVVVGGDHRFLGDILEVLEFSSELLRPFVALRELLDYPFPDGDSPLDFIADPRRAGELFLDSEAAPEELTLCWISRVKHLSSEDDFPLDLELLWFLDHCGPNPEMLRQ